MTLADTLAARRRDKALWHHEQAHAHPLGSLAYHAHLKAHGAWIRAAQRAEAGDTRPVRVTASGALRAYEVIR